MFFSNCAISAFTLLREGNKIIRNDKKGVNKSIRVLMRWTVLLSICQIYRLSICEIYTRPGRGRSEIQRLAPGW